MFGLFDDRRAIERVVRGAVDEAYGLFHLYAGLLSVEEKKSPDNPSDKEKKSPDSSHDKEKKASNNPNDREKKQPSNPNEKKDRPHIPSKMVHKICNLLRPYAKYMNAASRENVRTILNLEIALSEKGATQEAAIERVKPIFEALKKSGCLTE